MFLHFRISLFAILASFWGFAFWAFVRFVIHRHHCTPAVCGERGAMMDGWRSGTSHELPLVTPCACAAARGLMPCGKGETYAEVARDVKQCRLV